MNDTNSVKPPPLPGTALKSVVLPPPLPSAPLQQQVTSPQTPPPPAPPLVSVSRVSPVPPVPPVHTTVPARVKRGAWLWVLVAVVILSAAGTVAYVMYERNQAVQAAEAEARRQKLAAEQAEAARQELEEKAKLSAAAAAEEKAKREQAEAQAIQEREQAAKEATEREAAEKDKSQAAADKLRAAASEATRAQATAEAQQARMAAETQQARRAAAGGTWTGQFQCGPLQNRSNTNPAPFNIRVSLVIRDGAMQLTRGSSIAPAYEERLSGTIQPDMTFQLAGRGRYIGTSSEWSTSFSGRLNPGASLLEARGQILTSTGALSRDCTLTLLR